MSIGDNYSDSELNEIMKKSMLQMPHIDFEDKVMEKINALEIRKETLRKNLRASWLFLLLSIILFPAGIMVIYNQIDFSFVPEVGKSINGFVDVLMPGIILIFSAVLLLQIDNLFRLTFRSRFY